MSGTGQYTRSGIYYERIGRGRPLILLHGWCLSGSMWLYEVDRLRDEYEVIVPDLPGFGRSRGAAGPYVLDRYVESLVELVADTGCSEYVLVGFAFGADVALAAAAKCADINPSGVVLAGITSGAAFPADRMVRSMRRDWPDFARRSAEVLTRRLSDATTNWLERVYAETSLAVAADVAALLGDFEPEDLCAHVDVPLLFVHGADDDVAPIGTVRQCAARSRDGRLTVLDDCDHLLVLDQPEAFHEAVSGFLSSIADPTPRGATT